MTNKNTAEGICEINENFTLEGVVILRCRIRLFHAVGEESIRSFYVDVSQGAFEYVKKELYAMASEAFSSDTDEKKKFYFQPFVYKLCGEVTLENEELFSQRLDVSLTRGREKICFFSDGHVWRKRKGLLLSPKNALKEHGVSVPKQKFSSALLCGDGALVLINGAWHKV
jgi:hypothetical protein